MARTKASISTTSSTKTVTRRSPTRCVIKVKPKIEVVNVKILPERGKLPSPGKRELADKNSIDKKLAAIRSIAGLLNDLSPGQIKDFDKAVRRRPLFNQ